MPDYKARLAVLKEHIKAESDHDMAGVLHGFTDRCFNDIACMPKPFVGAKKVAERYRKHWEGFPDFKVRVRRFLAMAALISPQPALVPRKQGPSSSGFPACAAMSGNRLRRNSLGLCLRLFPALGHGACGRLGL